MLLRAVQYPGITQYNLFFNSPIKVVKVVAVPDKLLFPVFACVYRWFEIPDLRSLESGAEWAEGSIDIVCFRPDRTVINPIDDCHFITAGKRHIDRMTGYTLHKHTERR